MKPLIHLLSPSGVRARLTTLIFHRVLESEDTMFPEEMHASRFNELCTWLAQWFTVLPLDEAIERHQSGRLPARALCITFDDGYEDNHRVAMPILKRHGLKATFFVATGFLNGGRMWNDTVVEAVRHAQGLHLGLRTVSGLGLDTLPIGSPAQRRAAVDTILTKVKYLPMEDRLEIVERIARAAAVRPTDKLMMTDEQVQDLHRQGMQVGAHTVHHPILATLSPADIETEIAGSKRALEQIIAAPVRVFAYPNGKPWRDYGPEAVAVARRAGFVGAVSTSAAIARAQDDQFQMPRFTPWDRTPSRFALRLAWTMLRNHAQRVPSD